MNRRAYQRALASFLGSSRIYLTHILAASRVSTSGGLGFHSHVARLKPFLRLAASLVRHNCHITLITPHPTVLLAEFQYLSDFLSAFPQVTEKQFHLLPIDPPSADSLDPFFSCSGDPFATLLTFSFYPLFSISSP